MAAETGTQKGLRVQIVDLQPGDLPAVRALELECFSDAWSEKLLQDLLTSSWDKAWVLKEDETVCGYCNFRVIAGEGELMRIAVHGGVPGAPVWAASDGTAVKGSRGRKRRGYHLGGACIQWPGDCAV